jgi:hypothetical protein
MAEQLARHVLRRAHARRAVGQLAGIGLGVGDEVGDRLHRQVVVDEEDRRHHQRGRDRRQVLERIVRQRLQAGQDGDGGVAGPEQRVTVGRRLGDAVGADGAGVAGDVLDHDRLAPRLGELVGEQTRGDVGGAARREADDELDRLVGPLGLRGERLAGEREHKRGQRAHETMHGSSLWREAMGT